MKDLMVFTKMEFIKSEPLEKNPMISKVKIRVAQANKAQNGYILTKEVIQDAAEKSLALTPIVTFYNPFKKEFGEHGEQAVLNELDEYVTTASTQAVGVVPENPNIYWDDEDYLVTDGYLWTGLYSELKLALQGRPQSMELSLENTIMEPQGRLVNIIETKFQALCILGINVTPAFAGAKIEGTFSREEPETIQEGVDRLMDKLKFALDNDFVDIDAEASSMGTPLVVDTDGEERDKANREKLSEAIDDLDEAATLIEDEKIRNLIDDTISNLVDTETHMKKEADVIPITEAARRGLQGQPGYKDGVVSTENLNYKESLTKKDENEEEDTLANKKVVITKKPEDEEVVEEVPAEKVEQPVVEDKGVSPEEEVKEEEVISEEEKPSDDGNADGETGKPEEESPIPPKPIEEKAEDIPEAALNDKAKAIGEQIPADPQGAAADTIAEGRKTAESKRTGALLSDVGDDELFSYLMDRVEAAEDMKTRLQQMLQSSVPEQLPEGGETEIQGETTPEDLDVKSVENPGQAEVPEIGDKDAEPDSKLAAEGEKPQEAKEDVVPAKEDAKEEDAPAEEKAPETPAGKEEAPKQEEKEEVLPTEEEKKKKPQFSAQKDTNSLLDSDEGISFKSILAENERLFTENDNLKKANADLMQFKVAAENEAKENLLLEFSLSEEGRKAIRDKFVELSIEEVEVKAAVAQHREFKNSLAKGGQKALTSGIEFSLETDEDEPDFGKDSLEEVLRATKESLRNKD